MATKPPTRWNLCVSYDKLSQDISCQKTSLLRHGLRFFSLCFSHAFLVFSASSPGGGRWDSTEYITNSIRIWCGISWDLQANMWYLNVSENANPKSRPTGSMIYNHETEWVILVSNNPTTKHADSTIRYPGLSLRDRMISPFGCYSVDSIQVLECWVQNS